MNLLPQASGMRPRLACEISPAGVVAARAESATAGLSAASRVPLAPFAVQPGLKPGNLADRVSVIAAVRRALEETGVRPSSRGADLTLVVPDAAVRVLLLDFDALPNKLSEALPIVRFRLKKLLPFEADDAMISYQVMSTSRTLVRVLAVAIPRDVLAEYETAVREAGYEPGAVLPSTLACIAALDDGEPAALVVNANESAITTAIVRSGILLLHRSVDLQPSAAGIPANAPAALSENYQASALPLEAAASATPALPPVYREPQRHGADMLAYDIAEAVSVATAYYEDTLAAPPNRILSAGPLGADTLQQILADTGVAQGGALHVRELVDSSAFSAAAGTSVPRSWLGSVYGGLRG